MSDDARKAYEEASQQSDLKDLFTEILETPPYVEWRQEYLGEPFQPDEEYLKAEELWVMYYYDCERYDRLICTAFHKELGEAIPASAWESKQVNANARRQYADLRLRAESYGISPEVLRRAGSNVVRWGFRRWAEYLENKKR